MSHSKSNASIREEEEEEDGPPMLPGGAQPLALTLMAPARVSGVFRSTSSSSRSTPPSKIKVFFDTLINLPPKPGPEGTSSTSRIRRPRLIYVRDFPTLAASSPSWYPTLLNAVRARRKGPLSRPSSPITNPMTIIFGITPPITPSSSQNVSGGTHSAVNFLANRSPSPQAISVTKPQKPDWTESDTADRMREKRLRDRLQRWEKGDSPLLDELNKLTAPEAEEQPSPMPNIIILGQGGPLFGGSESSNAGPSSDHPSPFFRASVILPGRRSVSAERESRISRRREINELTLRMAVGSVGGSLEKGSPVMDQVVLEQQDGVEDDSLASDAAVAEGLLDESTSTTNASSVEEPVTATEEPVTEADTPPDAEAEVPPESSPDSTPTSAQKMWEDWGNRVETWDNVCHIADNAVGNVVASQIAIGEGSSKPSLDSTLVPWSAVYDRWAAHQTSPTVRKQWVQETSSASTLKDAPEERTGEAEQPDSRDDLIERLKAEGELDPHETRLLTCIVDSGMLTVSYQLLGRFSLGFSFNANIFQPGSPSCAYC